MVYASGMSLVHDLQFAVQTAREAGRIASRYYGTVERLTKTHSTTTSEAVTEADRATQRYIVESLKRRFPEDGIIGEESDTGESITFECSNPQGRNWIIDPIDGTNNFISGLGVWGVCLGLMDKGFPVLGVVYDVTRDQVYCAASGEGAWLGNRRIRVLETGLSDASMLMMSSNLIDASGRCPQWACRWIGQTNWKIRVMGSAAIEAVQVASGVAHGAVTVNGKLWDCVAAAAVVLEAGGTVTDLQGHPIFPYELNGYTGLKVPFLSAAPRARDPLLEYIRMHP